MKSFDCSASSSIPSVAGLRPSWDWSSIRSVPRRSQVSPRFGGREDTISRRIREASLHPYLSVFSRLSGAFPDVDTPICNGPSRWVERRENVQFAGESAQLTGIRNLLHNDAIQFTGYQSGIEVE